MADQKKRKLDELKAVTTQERWEKSPNFEKVEALEVGLAQKVARGVGLGKITPQVIANQLRGARTAEKDAASLSAIQKLVKDIEEAEKAEKNAMLRSLGGISRTS